VDNVTHSLIGLLLARAAGRHVGSLRGAIWAAVLASNLPDADIVLGPFFEDRKLGYLVQHRGYTHTVVGALALAGLATWIAARRDPAARRGPLLGLALVAAALHVGADGWNNYGIHPFWPLDPDWWYGDSVFIVEPLLWAALLPLLWVHGRVGRWLWGAALTFLTVVSGVMLGPVTAGGVLAFTLALTWAQAARPGVLVPGVTTIVVLTTFIAGGRFAREALQAPNTVDIALTPRPAAPWCWDGLRTTLDGDTYAVTSVRVSLLDRVQPEDCGLRLSPERTAPVHGEWRTEGHIATGPAFVGSVTELRALVAKSCRADSVMRFARAPFWTDRVIGDLRYDFEPELGFAEAELGSEGCVDAPWRSKVARKLLGE
jgi:inner membrane protein